MNLNLETESELSDDGEINHSIKHKIIDDEMVSFDNKTVKYLQNFIFNQK